MTHADALEAAVQHYDQVTGDLDESRSKILDLETRLENQQETVCRLLRTIRELREKEKNNG